MRPLLVALILVIVSLSLVVPSAAQDPLLPGAGTWRYTRFDGTVDCGALSGTRTLEDSQESETFESEFSVYVFDEGNAMLFVFAGADYLLRRSGPAEYTGSLVSKSEEVISELILTVEDETHMTAQELYVPREECTSTYDLAYEWIDADAAELWSETEREFSNFTFPTCLGLAGSTEPSGVWIRSDPFVPIRRQQDPSALVIGRNVYEAAGETYFRATDSIIADKNHHYQWTLSPLDDDTIRIDFLYQVDEREDCAVANHSDYVRITLDDPPQSIRDLIETPEP